MRHNAEHVARVALALASVPAAEQTAIIKTLSERLDHAEVEARRNVAIRDAHRLVGSPRILANCL